MVVSFCATEFPLEVQDEANPNNNEGVCQYGGFGSDGQRSEIGIWGQNSDGTVVITTVYTADLPVCRGTDPEQDTAVPVAAALWEQVLQQVAI